MRAAFAHRTLLGWINEFVNRPLPGVWPQIPLDDETIGDFEAYFRNADIPEVGLFYVDGRLVHEQEPNPAVYLEKMSVVKRKDYAEGIAECAATFAKVEEGIGQKGKAELTARCLQTVRAEVDRLER
jgi:hypothetical protein